jgi:c-di-GMP-binding flagellar brake protein YcgR
MEPRSDRRKDVRTSVRLPVELAADGDALSVSSLNIGAGGVYVEVPRFIEPLTKLSLSMMIPGPTPEEETSLVETEAIVVRILPERPDPRVHRYEIACAFLDLSDEHRDIVNRYILTHRAVPT